MSRGDSRRQPGQPRPQPGGQPALPALRKDAGWERWAIPKAAQDTPGSARGPSQRLPWEGEEDGSTEPSSPARELPGAHLHPQQDRQELPAAQHRRGAGEEGEPSSRLSSARCQVGQQPRLQPGAPSAPSQPQGWMLLTPKKSFFSQLGAQNFALSALVNPCGRGTDSEPRLHPRQDGQPLREDS